MIIKPGLTSGAVVMSCPEDSSTTPGYLYQLTFQMYWIFCNCNYSHWMASLPEGLLKHPLGSQALFSVIDSCNPFHRSEWRKSRDIFINPFSCFDLFTLCTQIHTKDHLIYLCVGFLTCKAAKITPIHRIVVAVKRKDLGLRGVPRYQSLCTYDSPVSTWGKPHAGERDATSCIYSVLYIAGQCFKSLKCLNKLKIIMQRPGKRIWEPHTESPQIQAVVCQFQLKQGSERKKNTAFEN